MRILKSATLAIAIGIALYTSSSSVSTQSSPQYGVNDLGNIGGQPTIPLAVAGGYMGNVVGYGTTASGDVHAFGGPSLRSLYDLGTLGGRGSEAHAQLRSGGSPVGRAQTASGAWHAFMSGSGGLQDLGTLGGSLSSAEGITQVQTGPSTSKYVVVGTSRTAGDATTRAFSFDTSTGTMSDLGAMLGGSNTAATAINSNAHVAGYADLPPPYTPAGVVHHAFLYMNGATQDLGTLGQNSEASALNDSDVVVGRWQAGDLSSPWQAFRYANGAMQNLGTLGGGSSEALAISPAGVIVGWAQTSSNAQHAFIWSDGVMTDLNTLIPSGTGWVLEAATGIATGISTANAGRESIVGYGQYQGQRHAFFLTPPIDLGVRLQGILNDTSTNFPNPHEAGRGLTMASSVSNNAGFDATNVVVRNTFTGPVQIDRWSAGQCTQDGLQLTCTLGLVLGAGHGADLMIWIHATGPGAITHSAAIISADQPDPNTANNSTATESNRAIALDTLTLAKTTAAGGESVLGRTTLTSPAPSSGATVTLTSSNPAVASVPSQFDVLLGCCDGGMWREFYVTTHAVSAPVTVQISATYGNVTRTLPLTITPSATTSPYSGNPATIPGTIQAEDFDNGGEGLAYHDNSSGNNGGAYRSTDVDIEATADTGGGYDVGWTTAGEWLNYSVAVAQSGSYMLTARVAASGAGGTFHVEFGGVDKTGPLTIPNTGGWQSWIDISTTVSLVGGAQPMRIVEDTNGAGGVFGNFNYVRLTAISGGGTSTAYPSGNPSPIPGTIFAVTFDNGGEGVGYHDLDASNNGGAFRSTGVDIEAAGSAGTYTVGWIGAGEWLRYTVNVAVTGNYNVTLRVASPGGATMHVALSGASQSVSVPATGGWQAWTNVTVPMTLSTGNQVMTLTFDTGGMNIDYAAFATAAGGGGGGTGACAAGAPGTLSPCSGTPVAVPGPINAERFDNGGEGVAYHDSDAANSGGQFRTTGVDIETSSEGGYDVGWIAAGEWLNYTVNVTSAGNYTVQLRVASPSGASLHVGFNGPSTGQWKAVTVPATGGWQNWTTVSVPVTLGAGTQQMTVMFDSGGMNFRLATVGP